MLMVFIRSYYFFNDVPFSFLELNPTSPKSGRLKDYLKATPVHKFEISRDLVIKINYICYIRSYVMFLLSGVNSNDFPSQHIQWYLRGGSLASIICRLPGKLDPLISIHLCIFFSGI
ncbi:116aa long hypothetical protein [Pyrococcus horikoshii OT3]|uniref:Uncharacterized protein n=1 Tax=Pyrococcus horikoshii (strain ATCC 700860 / DSM 12428 / JCM 9974 / NBRC 100139 / OT-3) TaxID=70601 RepID=O58513_PYRHO|nr:116aa long hypothetical protein [Pyrococcus horikoshii OT3]